MRETETASAVRPAGPSATELLGLAVRRRRRGLGLTLESVGRRTRLSKSFLSQLESGRTNPTLDTLTRIAAALGSSPASLLGAPDGDAPAGPLPAPPATTRRPARPARPLPVGSGRSYPLTGPEARRYEVVMCDGTPTHHERMVSHPGEEFCYVVSGALRVELGGRPCLLQTGESLHFASDTPHRLTAQTPATRFLLTL
ncbi:helix-turn-helix domain-containing protein [Streptacidiphilus cavernicola]|uniref:Helix-turn-helix domain-containing protein n=1 Tax=Streptacidiphilus cavernicola TaxID=3342716 RepID=A0ABV6VRQ3_9ACTN